MRSGSLLLFFAATLCAVEEVAVKASSQEETAAPSFRNARRLFAAEQNGDKTSSMTGEKALSQAGALGSVLETGSLGSLVAASSAAYLLLSHFVALKNKDGMHAQARELSGDTEGFTNQKHAFLTRRPLDVPVDKLTEELKNTAQAWRELMEEAKNKGEHLTNTAFDTLRKAHLLDDSPHEKDPHIKKLRIATHDMLRIIKKVLKMKTRLEEMGEVEFVEMIVAEIVEMLKFMRNMRRVMTRIIVEKAVLAKESIAAAREKLQNKHLVEAMNKLRESRTNLYDEIRDELSSEGEAVEGWLEDAGYHYYWRINPYYHVDKIIVQEKKDVDNAKASLDSSPPRAVLTKTVDALAQQAKKLVELNTEESELAKARAIVKEARNYTKESYSHTYNICKLVQKPLEEINSNAGDLLHGAGSDLRNVYAAINGAEDLLEILEDIDGDRHVYAAINGTRDA